MGRTEDSLYRALSTMLEEEPDFRRHMFVFPGDILRDQGDLTNLGFDTAIIGEMLLIRRRDKESASNRRRRFPNI